MASEDIKVTPVPNSDLRIIQFEDAAQPVFLERPGQPYVLYGAKNDYPNYLLYLYNNSAKHSAIINGKVDYVVGKGWDYEKEGVSPEQIAVMDGIICNVNAKGESLKAVTAKLQLDIEIFNGGYLNVIWDKKGGIASIYHLDYTTLRSNKDNSMFYVSDEWVKYNKNGTWKQVFNPEYETFPAYNEQNKKGSQILYIKKYHPGINTYTLPSYRGSITWIEVDVEIGNYHLNNVKGGFFANKIINFNNGVPTEEAQAVIELMFTKKFAGTRGRKFMLAFNNDATRAASVVDLNVAESDKLFDQLNKTGQQEIFTGHRITSPILFGIKTEGQLGGRTEIRESYEIFQNTYVNGQQQWSEETINPLMAYKGASVPLCIQRTEPISFEFSEATQSQNMSKDEIREKMGLPPAEAQDDEQTQRIINAISNLPLPLQQAVIAQLSPAQLLSLVGIQPAVTPAPAPAGVPVVPTSQQAHHFSAADDERDAAVFAEFGKPRSEHFIVKTKKVLFISDKDEQLHFADTVDQMTDLQRQVLEMLNGDPTITQQTLADALGVDVDSVIAAISALNDMGAIDISEIAQDGETIVQRQPTSDAIKRADANGPITKTVEVKYSYEGPQDSRNRPFCAKVLALDRMYSRKDIEQISARLGYSVWARRGGWYHNPATGQNTPYCRHIWQANVVVNNLN